MRNILVYFLFALIVVIIAALGLSLFNATKIFMQPTAIATSGLIIASILIGIAAFFNPCVLPLLPAFLYYQGTLKKKETPGTRVFLNGLFAALGLITFMIIFGLIIGALGESLINFVKPGTTFLIWFRRAIGTALIALGIIQLYNIPIGLSGLEKTGRTGFRLQNPSVKLYAYGFGYTLAGIGCVGPLVGGLAIFAIGSGGLTAGLLSFGIASLTMAIIMIALSVLITTFGQNVIQRLAKYTSVVRKIGGILLLLLGIFMWIITFSPTLSEILP